MSWQHATDMYLAHYVSGYASRALCGVLVGDYTHEPAPAPAHITRCPLCREDLANLTGSGGTSTP